VPNKRNERPLRLTLAVLVIAVVCVCMATGLVRANLGKAISVEGDFMGPRTYAGWPFIHASGIWLSANVILDTTFLISAATVLMACSPQRGATWKFSLSDAFTYLTAAGIAIFLALWDRNLAVFDLSRHFPQIGDYCPLARFPLHVQLPIWFTVYCVVVAAIRMPHGVVVCFAKRRLSHSRQGDCG